MQDSKENNNNDMMEENPLSCFQDGIRSASMMLFSHHVTTTYDEYAPTIELYQSGT